MTSKFLKIAIFIQERDNEMIKLKKLYQNTNFEQYDGFRVIDCLAWLSETKETKWYKFIIPNGKYNKFRKQIEFDNPIIRGIRNSLYIFPSYLKDNEVSDYYDISVKFPQK